MDKKRMRFILPCFFAAVPVMIAISAILYVYGSTLRIVPSEKYGAIGWWPYRSEKSVVDSLKTTSSKIEFEYTLDGSPAYAGFSINLDYDYPFLDLSGYSELTLKLHSSRASHFGVIIQTFEKGITQLRDGFYNPLRYNQIRTEITRGSGTYTIKLADLEDPEWWISLNAPRGKTLSTNPLKESAVLQIFFDDMELSGQKDTVEVGEISFHSSSGILWMLLIAGTICYYAVFGAVLVLPRIRRRIESNRATLLSSYKKIAQVSTREKEAEAVSSYIMEKYDDPGITLESVSTETGIPQKRIAEIVRKEYAMTLKECVNWLRIQEAKRLLTETDLSITDIAFKLGFNSNSYFGSIFRNREKLSPKEYREKHGHAK